MLIHKITILKNSPNTVFISLLGKAFFFLKK